MRAYTARDAVMDGVTTCAFALAATIAIGGGFSSDVFGVRLSLRGVWRPAMAGVALLAVRLWRGRATDAAMPATDIVARVVLHATTFTAIGYWLTYLIDVCGGSDSYGYVSAAALMREGRLIEPQPMAAWLPVANPLEVATQAAYVPAADGSGSAPGYPLGFPLLIVVATTLIGPFGAFVVTPICGVASVALAWQLGRHWFGPTAGALAAAFVAWDPLVVAYSKQPMSDVPATMWTLLALWWLRGPRMHPMAAGVATGLSFLTRPGGLGAVAVLIALAVGARQGRGIRFARFAVGAVPFALLHGWLQWHLFGSPLATGYGSVARLYAGATVWENARIYASALWQTHSMLWFASIAAAWRTEPRSPWWLAAALLGALALPYLLYFSFDHWETLRFLLPAVTVLSVVAAGGLVTVAPRRWVLPFAAVCAIAAAASSLRFLDHQGAPAMLQTEQRYTRVASRLERTTAPNAVVLSAQHSGSIRHYAHRTTLRWDVLRADDLVPLVQGLRDRGHDVYVALEGTEQQRFDAQFATPLAELQRVPYGQELNVQIWQLNVGR